MNPVSALFWIILSAIALLATYLGLFPLPATIVFGRFLGLAAFLLLCVSLLIGPLSVIWPRRFALLIEPRRAVGLSAFVFLGLHSLFQFVLIFGFSLDMVLADLRFWIAIPAVVIFGAMALTSSDSMVRRLGNVLWKNLHRLTYLAFVLVFVHFLLNATGLFVPAKNSVVFVNLAELSLVVLGVVTVLFQVAGFFAKRKQLAAAEKSK